MLQDMDDFWLVGFTVALAIVTLIGLTTFYLAKTMYDVAPVVTIILGVCTLWHSISTAVLRNAFFSTANFWIEDYSEKERILSRSYSGLWRCLRRSEARHVGLKIFLTWLLLPVVAAIVLLGLMGLKMYQKLGEW